MPSGLIDKIKLENEEVEKTQVEREIRSMKVSKIGMRSDFLLYGLLLFFGLSFAGCTKCSREEGAEAPPAVEKESDQDSAVAPPPPGESQMGEEESMGESDVGEGDDSMPSGDQGEAHGGGQGEEWPDEEPMDAEEDHD